MKKLRTVLLTAGVAVAALPALAATPTGKTLPTDPAVRIGRLDNGLTYYIQKHDYPKGQADFFIAQNVGAIQEEDSQRGLAHFLEHMCFNGTEHFPGNSLIGWLESVGVKFGQNLNAATYVDRTVYNLSNVPTARTGVQDSCLLILRDWADGLTLSPDEIDAERKVIHEEWRQGNNGMQRIVEGLLPKMYPGSKYGYRLPIGTLEVIDNFPYKVLRDYYEKWYRPDLQAIMVVGDIDPDRIEGKIRELFGPIAAQPNGAPLVREAVPDTKGTIYAIGKDKEMPYTIMELMFKRDATPNSLKNSIEYIRDSYVNNMISNMLNSRLKDMTSKPESPASEGSAGYGNYFLSSTKDAFTLSALPKGDNALNALAAVYREGLRAVRHGFTQAEYDRARSEFLSRLERNYTNRATRTSTAIVGPMVEHFTKGEPLPGIEATYAMMNMLAPQITLEQINKVAATLMPVDNRVLLAAFPDKEGVTVPDSAQFAATLAAVDAEKIEAYVDNVKNEPLIAKLPAPGKIVATATDPLYGATVWTLSNGAKVVARPTDFKAGEIIFNARAMGGTSTLSDSLNNELRYLDETLGLLGMGPYDKAGLNKYLAGKQAMLSLSLSSYTRDLRGNVVPRDLPVLMEMIHAMFTAPTLSADEFEASKHTNRSVLANQGADPRYQFGVKRNKYMYASERAQDVDLAVIEGADREKSLDIIKDAMSNAGEYTFYFVGSFTLDELKPLVEKYIANLPGHAVAEAMPTQLPELAPRRGNNKMIEEQAMDTPTTFAYILVSGDMPFTARDQKLASIAGQILSARLIKIVREELGAVYSISARGGMGRLTSPNATLYTAFPMKPEMRDTVINVINEQIDLLTDPANITAEELNKVKEFMVKTADESMRRNGAMLDAIQGYQLAPVDTYLNAASVVKSITAADVADYMKRLTSQGHRTVYIMDPAKK